MDSSMSLALPLPGSSHAPTKKKKTKRRRRRAVTTAVVAVVVVAATRMTGGLGPAAVMSGIRIGRREGAEKATTTEGMRLTTSVSTAGDGDTMSSPPPPPSSWLPFSSANDPNNKPRSRISYQFRRLKNNTPAFWERYGFKKHNCIAGHERRRVWPREQVIEAVGVVDFQTHITTSMKIAVVGDSVGVQIAHRLEEAMWDEEGDGEDLKAADRSDTNTTTKAVRRRVVHDDKNYQYAAVSHPVRGNGTLVTFRANGLLQRRTRDPQQHEPTNQHLEPNRRLLQRRRKLQEFFRAQPYNQTILDLVMDHPALARSGAKRGTVDVLVQRVVYPWIQLDQITYESLVENAQVATELFGMETLVLINLYFCNNVVGPDMYRQYLHRLNVIRNFTQTYRPSAHSSSLQRILLLDMDRLGDAFNDANGQSLGFDTVNEPFEDWMVSHYMGPNVTGRLFRRHIGQVCSTRVPDHSTRCPPNMVWVDGLHFCPSTWAGRLTAGIACLIDCGEQHHHYQLQSSSVTDGDNASSWKFLRKCERNCNDKFMSLSPIPISEMVS